MNQPKIFTADEAKLLIDGKVHVPTAAAGFAEICQSIHKTAWHSNAAFAGTSSGLGQSWSALRDLLQELTGRTSDNLLAIAESLVSVAEHYAATDANAASEIAAVQAQLNGPGDPNDPDDVGQPAPAVPDRPRPGDPLPPIPNMTNPVPVTTNPGPGSNVPV